MLAHESVRVGELEIANCHFEEEDEIYRDLHKAAQPEGLFGMSDDYIRKELTM